MRRITMAVMSTISGLVLLFSYHTSTNSPASAAPEPEGATGGPAATGGGASSDSGSSGSGSSGSGSSGSATYTGDTARTRWGPVQVKITVSGGKITSSEAVVYPSDNSRDQEINAFAVPQLNAEAVAAQSAQIDAVSGATVTSDGYVESLQSAIDQAHL